MPLYLGTNCIAGFKKFHPRCKRHIDTACSWLNNWSRVTRKVQAMPLHPDLVKAFVAFGLLKKRSGFCFSGVRRLFRVTPRLRDIQSRVKLLSASGSGSDVFCFKGYEGGASPQCRVRDCHHQGSPCYKKISQIQRAGAGTPF